MYRLTFILTFMLFLSASVSAQSLFHTASTVNVSTPPTAVKFTLEKEVHDFGQVSKGIPVSHTFSFTNTGSTPIVLEKVTPACGCTTLEYTKEAIKPGEEGYVTAQYNAAKVGYFNKSVSLKFNGDESFYYVKFKGEVVE